MIGDCVGGAQLSLQASVYVWKFLFCVCVCAWLSVGVCIHHGAMFENRSVCMCVRACACVSVGLFQLSAVHLSISVPNRQFLTDTLAHMCSNCAPTHMRAHKHTHIHMHSVKFLTINFHHCSESL